MENSPLDVFTMARRNKIDTTTDIDAYNPAKTDSSNSLQLATYVAAAYLANNHLSAADIPSLLKGLHETFSQLAGVPSGPEKQPAVAIKKSVTDDFIICLEDGKKLRTLKRYLNTHYDMTPDQYRAKWRLPGDYPMVAPSYAKLRSSFAKKIGLGRTSAKRRGRKVS